MKKLIMVPPDGMSKLGLGEGGGGSQNLMTSYMDDPLLLRTLARSVRTTCNDISRQWWHVTNYKYSVL